VKQTAMQDSAIHNCSWKIFTQ